MADVLTAKNGVASPAPALAVYPEWDWNRILTLRVVLLMLPIVGLVLWAYPYWLPGGQWESRWRSEAAWGHGYLIPFLAVLIASFRLKEYAPVRIVPSAWGLPVILAGLVIRIWSQTLMFGYPGEVTFLIVVSGVVLLVLGWPMLRILWVPIAYMGLMIPWEPKYYEGVALPLQNIAAMFSEHTLRLFGMSIAREGNVLLPEGSPRIDVAHACSGLHLLLTFVALGVLMAYMYRRPLWERLTIMVSSVPIAVFCNILRVMLMTVSSHAAYVEAARAHSGNPTWSASMPDWLWSWIPGGSAAGRLETIYENVMTPDSYLHQSFGFAMLGLAFVLMWAELKAIDMLFVDDEPPAPSGSDPAAPDSKSPA